jgi:hypothetical protein
MTASSSPPPTDSKTPDVEAASSGARQHWIVHVTVFGAMTGIATVILWPLLTHLKTCLPFWYFDTWLDTWTVWWMRQALWVHPHNPFVSNLAEYPLGAEMYWHNVEFAKSAFGVFLVPGLGAIGAHNLLIWSTFPLAGYSAWLLVRYILEREGFDDTTSSCAAFAGATAYAFSRYHLCHAEAHLNLTAIEGIPFYLFFFIRYLDRGRRWDLFGLSCGIVYTAFSDSYYLVYAAVLSGLWVLAEAGRRGALFKVRNIFTVTNRRAVTVVFTVAVVLSPWLGVLIKHAFPPPSSPFHGDADFNADIVGYLLPDRISYWFPKLPPAWRDLSGRIEGDNEENGLFLGYLTPLAGYIAYRWHFLRAGTRWLAFALFFISLSFGFELHYGTAFDTPVWFAFALPAFALALLPGSLRPGIHRDAWITLGLAALGCKVLPVTANGVPFRAHILLPYSVFKTVVPFFSRGGMPDRFVLCATISVAVLFGAFVARLGTRIAAKTNKPWVAPLVMVSMAAIPCAEYWPRPMNMEPPPPPPPVFEQIRKEPPQIAVFTDASPMAQFEQITFNHPISYARMARIPVALDDFERPKRILQVLHHERTMDQPVSDAERKEMHEYMKKYHFRYYIAHFWDDARDKFVREQLGGRLLYRAPDSTVIVYRFDEIH